MKNFMKMALVFMCVILIAGCATGKKKSRMKSLEEENQKLVAQIEAQNKEQQQQNAKIKVEYNDKMDALRAEKNAQINKLQSELERNITMLEKEKEQEIEDLKMAKERLEKDLKKEIDGYKAKLSMTDQGLVVTFLDEVLFDSGKAEIRVEGLQVLDYVANALTDQSPESLVRIEGHTDNVPIKYSGWKSNWNLSCARAVSVLHYFTDEKKLKPERFAAVGYGQYRPVASNDTREGRQQNRRVEIIISPERIKKVNSKIAEKEPVGVEIESFDTDNNKKDELEIINIK